MPGTNDKGQPVREIRVGNCKAAIWANESDGRTFHSVTFSRLYKTDDGWRSSPSFGSNDLPHLAFLAPKVHAALEDLAPQDRDGPS